MRSRSKISALVALLAVSTLSASAMAQEPAARKKPKKAVIVAAKDEPKLPPPPAEPTPAPAPLPPAAPIVVDVPPVAATNKDKAGAKPVESDDEDDIPSAGTGFVGNVNLGGEVLMGEIASNYSVGAGFTTLNGSAGYYVTPHVGLFAGLKIGFGTAWDCGGACTTASTFQIPVTIQYALVDRTRGAYFDGGLGIVSSFKANMKSDLSVAVSSPVDAKFGAGYRWKSKHGSVTQSMDLHVGIDAGQYSTITAKMGSAEASGDIASDKKALHGSLAVGVGWQF